MTAPLQLVIPPEFDLAYQQMWSAYQGDTDVWRRVTIALRDAQVDHAIRRCPYYARTIPRGARFEDIPILTKPLIREHFDDLVAKDAPEHRKLSMRTAGTSGEPLSFLRDTAGTLVDAMASDRFFRALHNVPFTATIIAVNAVSRGGEPYSRWSRISGRVRAAVAGEPARDPWLLTLPLIDVGPGDVQRYLDRWNRLRGYFFVGQSSGIDWLAQQIEEQGLRLQRPPVAIAATSDTLTEHARLRMERVFGAPVHARYGSNEFPFLAGSQPGRVDRFLFNPLLAYVELLDDEDRPVPPGELGRVVLTNLNERVMPLIRYQQGDLAVASPEGYVGGFRVVEGLIGREAELLRFPSGRAVGGSALGQLLVKRHDFAPWVRNFQCVQTGPNELELRVAWARDPGDARTRIAAAVREAADPDTVVRVRDIDEPDRYPSGKVWVVRGLQEPAGDATPASPSA
ncbi:MAG: hypothetical protein ACRDHB_00230 [Actinomycetota bacterium]